ncbi:MAG: DUF2089 domain-containing protein [Terracidiphilus sp.]
MANFGAFCSVSYWQNWTELRIRSGLSRTSWLHKSIACNSSGYTQTGSGIFLAFSRSQKLRVAVCVIFLPDELLLVEVGPCNDKNLLFALTILIILITVTAEIEKDNQRMPNDPKSAPQSSSDWQELLRIAEGSQLVVERVRIPEKQIAIEGQFTLPQLSQLSLEDQVFVVAFLRSHGSIKEMEQTFGVSYPTIKSRLNRISGLLEFIDNNPSPTRTEVLNRLNSGDLSPADAIRALEALK